MNEQTIRAELKEHFGNAMDDDNILSAFVSLCKTYNAKPEELFYQWESMSYNSNAMMSQITGARIPEFREHLQRELKKTVTSTTKRATVAIKGSNRGGFGTKSALGARTLASATVGSRQDPVKMEEDAMDSGFAASNDVSLGTSGVGSSRKNRVVPSENIKDYSYRYMHETMIERSNVLETRIQEFSAYVSEYYDVADIGDPNAMTENDIVVVGRICDASETKLSEGTLVLEPSKSHGGGRRIPLGLASNLAIHLDPSGQHTTRPGIGLFPGAIAAFKGRTAHGPEGTFFQANEVLPLPPLKAPSKTSRMGALSYTVLIASGPYTPDSDLNYKPFLAVLDAVRKAKPQVLILLGPFVDGNHPMIRDGDVEQSFDDIFLSRIAVPLRNLVLKEHPELSVAIMPSVRDTISYHDVYPQSSDFGPDKFKNWVPSAPTPPFSFLSNPSTFTIHGVSYGATTVDVLAHIKKQEIFRRIPQSAAVDPMGEACRYILDQRSFYPLYPVPEEFSKDVNLDVTHSHLLELRDPAPDVIILPSRLNQFCKVVEGTVFVNPSTASKFTSNGAIARVTVDAMKTGPERISVDLNKL